ncbi:MAG: hypothetical protein IJH84_11905 [Saccharopolyspora sp.]|uniref:hypothetical protein n=1 Tax=Saccharopolyspora sp. TaxID=33915 RepID=UPI0025F64910|nr:hypothetical protein [Saccharopolyspora sp.]MBQ6641722.1 hypothetical protein [Saccharopolyspora sp.]
MRPHLAFRQRRESRATAPVGSEFRPGGNAAAAAHNRIVPVPWPMTPIEITDPVTGRTRVIEAGPNVFGAHGNELEVSLRIDQGDGPVDLEASAAALARTIVQCPNSTRCPAAAVPAGSAPAAEPASPPVPTTSGDPARTGSEATSTRDNGTTSAARQRSAMDKEFP